MSNAILTHQMIAREGAALLKERMSFVSRINRKREDDLNAKVNGYRKGGFVDVVIPPASKVFDGANFAGGGAAPDQVETKVRLQLTNQKHVPLTFTAQEKAMKLENFRERFLEGAIDTLAAIVQSEMLKKAYRLSPNVIGTPGTLPNSAKTWSQGRALLERHLAPASPRTVLWSSDANVELVDASKALFNPNEEVAKMFLKGYCKSYADMDFFENQSLPTHTNGNDVTGVAVSGANQTGSTLTVSGVANGSTFTAGQVFTIDSVYDVHPLTGEAYPNLRQFVITADTTAATTTVALPIWPAINATAPGKTVSALPGDTAALTFVGAASTGYRQNLGFHRDAIATAFAPLPVLASCEGYTAEIDDIALRVMTFGDGKADVEHTRIDVLFADPAGIRPDHIFRVTE